MSEFDWLRQGACVGKPTDWWFDDSTELMARRICAGCPVRPTCFEYSVVDTTITVGVFGGATNAARNDERARRGIHVPTRYKGAYRASRTPHPRKAEQ